jgi:hypothetical protein
VKAVSPLKVQSIAVMCPRYAAIIALALSLTGCQTQRDPYVAYLQTRIEIAQANILNERTLADSEGRPNPYRRRVVKWKPVSRTFQVVEDPSPFRVWFNPGHPLADSNGYVRYPNVDRATEEVEILVAREELERLQ